MSKPENWSLTDEDITPGRIDNDATFIRGVRPDLSKRESMAAARRMLETCVDLQRQLSRGEWEDCIRQAVVSVARENVVKLDPERIVEFDE